MGRGCLGLAEKPVQHAWVRLVHLRAVQPVRAGRRQEDHGCLVHLAIHRNRPEAQHLQVQGVLGASEGLGDGHRETKSGRLGQPCC